MNRPFGYHPDCQCPACVNYRKQQETPVSNMVGEGGPEGTIYPSASAQRKATPVWAGVLRYFPDALAAVARLSKAGNDKHNPGLPLHWARDKSTDHGDCIARHQLTPELLDEETGELHAVAVAWRALAQLQLLEEKRLGTEAVAVRLAVQKAVEERVERRLKPVEQVDANPWMGWKPGFLRPSGFVQVKLRDGTTNAGPSSSFVWYECGASTIVAYRPPSEWRRVA